MNERDIRRLEEVGVSLFRINLSHTTLENVAESIRFIQRYSSIPICIDTEGAQIRTGNIVNGKIELRENSHVRASVKRVPGDDHCFNFNPLSITKKFEPGDFISIDFNAALVQVIDADSDGVTMRVLNGGEIGSSKAVTVNRDIEMPPLSDKDLAALEIAKDLGVQHFALSFANFSSDVEKIREIVGDKAFVISKIESINGLRNLDGIASGSDALLIDRGDLSRQVPLEQIPQIQKKILHRCKDLGIKVYVATNLLESMVSAKAPTRAEVNDIFNTLMDGASGLVLAAETAIGKYPIQCASMIVKMIQKHEQQQQHIEGEDFLHRFDTVSLLVPPHGGNLVQRDAKPSDLDGIEGLPSLEVSETDIMDCEQFAIGAYSPLTGFMDRQTLNSVLQDMKLPDGTVWTMPLVLQVRQSQVKEFGQGDRVALKGPGGQVYALLDVSDIYTPDLEKVAQSWFGATSSKHPGVERLMRSGETFVGGSITQVDRPPLTHRHYCLSPAQTRFIFNHKGWHKIVGFHSRNPAHRVHEFIQLQALERTGADGLYISPVIGPKKTHDFLSEPIMNSYRLLLDFGYYPKERVVLGGFATYSRYCGAREAVFTALCRKNMGCSHFIIGRDHTGVGDFYPADANQKMFETLGDIGVTPVFFNSIGYNPATGQYQEEESGVDLKSISGSQAREKLRSSQRLPDWFIRDIVQDMIMEDLANGKSLFHE